MSIKTLLDIHRFGKLKTHCTEHATSIDVEMKIKNFAYLASVLLVLAIFPWNYGYYQVLRLMIFIIGALVSLTFYRSDLNSWAIVFAFLALLFNPIFPTYLFRSAWIPIDLVASLLFFVAAQSVKNVVVK